MLIDFLILCKRQIFAQFQFSLKRKKHFPVSKKRTTAHLRTPFHYFQLTSRAQAVPLLLPDSEQFPMAVWSPYYSFLSIPIFTQRRQYRQVWQLSWWGMFPSCSQNVSYFRHGQRQYRVVARISPIQLPASNGENLIPLVIIVCMCEVFSPERRCTRHALQKHYTNRQIFKKF